MPDEATELVVSEPQASKPSEPDLDRFYGNLCNYVRMVTRGYSNLLMLDAKGGLGKTHNVRKTLKEELEPTEWKHQRGFTTPIELYKSLYSARNGGILFLDDMSGVTSSGKAIDMLKSATDTEGEENWVEYRTSRDIEDPTMPGATIPNKFCFRGSIIMSFNETPDNNHFHALKDRGTFYKLSLTYQERLELVDEIALVEDFSNLSVEKQVDVAEWIRRVTDASYDVTLRTFEEVCQMRHYSEEEGLSEWKRMALEMFDKSYEKHLIIDMRRNMDMSVEAQINRFEEKTGLSESTYYDYLAEILDE